MKTKQSFRNYVLGCPVSPSRKTRRATSAGATDSVSHIVPTRRRTS